MKLELSSDGVSVLTTHKDMHIQWHAQTLLRKSSEKIGQSYSGEDSEIFKEINEFWEHLPMDHQDSIYGCYARLDEVFRTVWKIDELTDKVQDLVAELLRYHVIDTAIPPDVPYSIPYSVTRWVKFHSNIIYPEGLDDVFIDGADYSKTRTRTYTKQDYEELITLAVALRPIFPIWSLFIHRIKEDVSNTFKEMKACKLLSRSPIYRTPAMDKLRVYLSEIGATDQSRKKAVFSGLSSTDLPEWLLGLAMVRRLSIAVLSTTPGTPQVVAFIHNYINQRISRDGGFNIGEIRDKKPERERQDSEQKLSVLEQFKIKEENPAGDTAFISFVLRNQRALLKSIQPDCPWQLVKEANESLKALETTQIYECQILIMKNVLNVAVSHQGITPQYKKDILSGMAVAQAVLIHRGYLELAALMTSSAMKRENNYMITSMETRTRISREVFSELDRYFPHPRRTTGRNRNSRQNNPASNNIDIFTDKLSEHAWRLSLPSNYVEQLTGSGSERLYTVPQNIKNILARFTIDNCLRQKALVEKALGYTLPDPPPAVDYGLNV